MPGYKLDSTSYNSLYHTMAVQDIMNAQDVMIVRIKVLCPLLFWVFCATLVFMIIRFFSELFFEKKTRNNSILAKDTVFVPVCSFIIGLIMIIFANSFFREYTGVFGDRFFQDVSATVVAYIELVLLAIIPLIELYKQFKCVDQPQHIPSAIVNQETTLSNIEELKKYKELLDQGVITEAEFNRKKEQLLK